MDLWIRSQDKRQLLKVNDGLFIANGFMETDDTFIGIKNVGHVGRYAEEERTIEILDEIQKLLKSKAMLKTIDNEVTIDDLVYRRPKEQIEITPLSNNLVYEMPKE